jgi:protein-S-isoprenylcysteine O-methyltransferase Ste14
MSPSTEPDTELDRAPASNVADGQPRNALAVRLSLRLLGAFLFLTGLIFVSAWTLRYWQAALYLLCVFIPVTVLSTALLARNPAVIERRLTTAERSRSQQALVRAFRPLFVLILFVPGLDHRFGISSTITGPVSMPVTLICDGLIVLALLFAGWVLQVNEFAGRSIRVEEDQPLIADGPYCIVRHPLYSASLLLWLATPLALGSWIAVPLFALLIPFYILRLMNEEMVLTRELKGYSVYCKRTPFRLIPFVW